MREYNLHGMRLRVEANGRLLGEAVDGIIGPFVADGPGEVDFIVTLNYAESPCADEGERLRLLWRGTGPGGMETVIYESQNVLATELPGLAFVRVDVSRGRADIAVKPGEESCLNHGCITPVLCEFLNHAGQHVIHAASLAAAAPKGERAVMLAGDSGAGKTTAALALAGASMRLMTDDASFVSAAGGERLMVWGLPRPCKVHRHTLELLPWLADLPHAPTRSDGEVLIELASLPGTDPKRKAAPGLVFLLAGRNDREHIFTGLDKVEAVAELSRQNVRTMGPAGLERARGSFAGVTALVRQSRCYRLSVGPQLDGLHDRVVELLGA